MARYNKRKVVLGTLYSWKLFKKNLLNDLKQSGDSIKPEDPFNRLFIDGDDEFCPIQSIEKKHRKNHLSGDEYYLGSFYPEGALPNLFDSYKTD